MIYQHKITDDMNARITATIGSGTKVDIANNRSHTWTSDELPHKGGTDTAPTPYELLVGSLAACTAVTLRLYADHKGIPLKAVRAEYEFDQIHIDDCDECEQEEGGMIDRMRSRVTLIGDFDEAQRKRLEQIVRRCPIHKTLTKGMSIFDHVDFEEPSTV
jgi:putative redox protein